MVKSIINLFVLFCSSTICFGQVNPLQSISVFINDSIKYINDKKDFVTLNVKITNNTDTAITLLFFNNCIFPSYCNNTNNDLLSMLDSNISVNDLNCSGLRFVIKNTQNNLVLPKIFTNRQINRKYKCKWSIFIINEKVINKYIHPIFLQPHENKFIKIKVYFRKDWKYPEIIQNRSTLVEHGYSLQHGEYSLYIYYLVNINHDYQLPDYVKYSGLCIPSPTSSKVGSIIDYPSLKNYLASGYFKSNVIKIIVK